jgi:N-dimethylarginine dimethylaminohydrolase
MLLQSTADLAGGARSFDRLALPDRVLMADPAEFDLRYEINPHMRDAAGNLQRVDRRQARRQWSSLAESFANSGLKVDLIPPLAGHPDLVFCANQVLPIPAQASSTGAASAVPSRMAHAERRGEVPHVSAVLSELGYRPAELQGSAARLEGMGDGLWVPGRKLLLGGCGPRTELAAWQELSAREPFSIVPLELIDPDFYHLDTAISVLDESSCLWFPEALSAASRQRIEALFPHRLTAQDHEARRALACNAFSNGVGDVWIEQQAVHAIGQLQQAGYRVHPVNTSEFLKSGGSVYCMKLLVWSVIR